MRLAWIIVAFTAIGLAVVHLRLEQDAVRTGLHRLEGDRLKVRRMLWDQHLRLGELTSPQRLRLRGREFALDMTGPEDALSSAGQTAKRSR
jgi:hypothetical protein